MNFSADRPQALHIIAETIERAPRAMLVVSLDNMVLLSNHEARKHGALAAGRDLLDHQGARSDHVSEALSQAARSSRTVPLRLTLDGEDRLFLAWRIAPLPGVGVPLVMLKADPANTIAARINNLTNARDRTRQALEKSREESDKLKRLARRLKHLASHDALTGLLNAHSFRSACTTLLSDGATVGALIYVDLDGFKPVNDSHGHAAGDAVLQAVGQRLVSYTPRSALCGRLGGDEFAVFLPGHDADSVQPMLAEVHRAFVTPVPWRSGSTMLTVGATMGVASAPADGRNTGSLIAAADQRMYAAKPGR